MRKLLCKIGWHKMGSWYENAAGGSTRRCRRVHCDNYEFTIEPYTRLDK